MKGVAATNQICSRELLLPEVHLELVDARTGAILLDHSHAETHLLIMIAGHLSEDGCVYRPGDVRLSAATDRHFLRFERASTCLLVRLPGHSAFEGGRERWSGHTKEAVIVGRQLARAILGDARSRDHAPDVARTLLAAVIICSQHSSKHDIPAWLREAHVLMRHAPTAVASVGQLARAAGVTREHFSRSFAQHYRTSVAAFLRRCRLAQAFRRIERTTHELARIAFESGFADQSHMTRSFVETFGITPGRIRTGAARESSVSR